MSKKAKKSAVITVDPTKMVQIRSVKQYFNEFIVEGLKDKEKIQEMDLLLIKQQILDAFRREVFGQIIFKFGPECAEMSTDDLADMDGVHNILQQAFRKWRRLCILCSEHGLGNHFQLEDLKNILEDQRTVTVPDLEEDITEEIQDGTVIVNEETLEPVGVVDKVPDISTGEEVNTDGKTAEVAETA